MGRYVKRVVLISLFVVGPMAVYQNGMPLREFLSKMASVACLIIAFTAYRHYWTMTAKK